MNKYFKRGVAATALTLSLGAALPVTAGASSRSSYLSDVYRHAPGLRGHNDSGDVVAVGHAACSALRSGDTVVQVIKASNGTGISQNQAAVMIGSAVKYFCPRQRNSVVAQIRRLENG